MKKLKKRLASVLVICMLLTFCVPVFASGNVTAASITDTEIAKNLGNGRKEEISWHISKLIRSMDLSVTRMADSESTISCFPSSFIKCCLQ